MTSLADIRAGIAANLEAVPDVQVSAYLLGSSVTPPALEIFPAEAEYDAAMGRGLDRWRLTVRAVVGTPTERGAQVRLDRMLAPSGPDSVKAAVESDPTLGGAVDDLRVTRVSGYRIYELPGRQAAVLGAEWELDVLAAG